MNKKKRRRQAGAMSTVVRPPPAATLAPLRERVWNAASQTRMLKEELLGVTFYRRIVSCEADAALVARLEEEFDALVSRAPELEPEGVYCVRFPPGLPGAARFLIARCAERFHLQPHSFGEDEDRFPVVYLHPRDAMAPVLRCADFALAKSYYTPAAPPAYEHKRPRYERTEKARDEYQLDATELFLSDPDFTPWTAAAGYGRGSAGADGYECEVAACHEHLVEVCGFAEDRPAPSLDVAAACIPTAVVLRPLPAGFVAVFASAADARAFLTDRAPPTGTPPGGTGLAPGAEPLLLDAGAAAGGKWACSGRPLSALHQRRALQLGSRGRGGAPRALQAALRGLGEPGSGGSRDLGPKGEWRGRGGPS